MPITPETLRVAEQMRAAVSGIIDNTTRSLTAAWVRAWDQIAFDVIAAIGELLQIGGGKWPSRRQIEHTARVISALDVIGQTLQRLAVLTHTETVTAATQAARVGAEGQNTLVASQLPYGSTKALAARYHVQQPDAIDAIVRRTAEQINAKHWPLADEATERMKRELVRGVVVGDNPRTAAARMVKNLEGEFNGGLTRALNIARTETLDAHREAARVGQEAHEDVLDGWVWHAELNSSRGRTCPACFALHGTEHPLTEPGPNGHQQCLVAGAVVSGPAALASSTRWYSGEVIDVETSAGRLLTVTPNHPVLTTDGWVAAGLLREGHYVLCGSNLERIPAGDNPDDHQVPALIEDVAETLGGSGPVDAVRMPTAAEDFHGDGAGSDVHVVRTNGLLRDNGLTALNEQVGEAPLCRRHMRLVLLATRGALDLVFKGERNAASGSLGGQHDASVLFGTAPGSYQAVGVRDASEGDTFKGQPAVDGGAGDAVALGEDIRGLSVSIPLDDLRDGQVALRHHSGARLAGLQGVGLRAGSPQVAFDEDVLESGLAGPVPSGHNLAAFAADVVADCVLNVRRRSFRGHVYNLQTSTGWYLANGIVVHNCRCSRTPKTKTWADLGFDVPEGPDLIANAREIFDGLPEAEQVAIMGRRRLDLLRSGDIEWEDLPQLRTTPEWRDSYGTRPVKDLERIAKQRTA